MAKQLRALTSAVLRLRMNHLVECSTGFCIAMPGWPLCARTDTACRFHSRHPAHRCLQHHSAWKLPDSCRCLFDHLLQLCPAQAALPSADPEGDNIPTPADSEEDEAHATNDQVAPESAPDEAAEPPEMVEWAAVTAIARWKLRTHSLAALDAAVGRVSVVRGPRFPAGAVALPHFCEAMQRVFADTAAAAATDELAALLTDAVELQPSRGLPEELAARVRAHPLYAAVPIMHVREVQAQLKSEAVSDVIGVDCRTADEYDVRPMPLHHDRPHHNASLT